MPKSNGTGTAAPSPRGHSGARRRPAIPPVARRQQTPFLCPAGGGPTRYILCLPRFAGVKMSKLPHHNNSLPSPPPSPPPLPTYTDPFGSDPSAHKRCRQGDASDGHRTPRHNQPRLWRLFISRHNAADLPPLSTTLSSPSLLEQIKAARIQFIYEQQKRHLAANNRFRILVRRRSAVRALLLLMALSLNSCYIPRKKAPLLRNCVCNRIVGDAPLCRHWRVARDASLCFEYRPLKARHRHRPLESETQWTVSALCVHLTFIRPSVKRLITA